MRRKTQEEKRKKITGRKLWNGSIVAALAASVTVFVVMLQMEKNMLTQYERSTIYVAAKEMPEGLLVTQDNYQEYFIQKELDKNVIPKSAIREPEQLSGLITRNVVDEGTLMTSGMFESVNEITQDMQEPVIAGFRVDDLYQVVGGTLRTGDRIHIYNVNEEGIAIPVWNDIYVQQVFDSAGVKITSADESTAAQRINVYMDKSDIERFYTELSVGTLRVVKACD